MKNLFLFFLLTTTLLLTSCSKEAIISTELEELSFHEAQNNLITPNNTFQMPDEDLNQSLKKRLKTIQLQVINVDDSISSGFRVTFSGNHDFTGESININQSLNFKNANNNISALNFQAINPVGSKGLLELTFTTGGQSLNDLDMENFQSIIIEDEIVN